MHELLATLSSITPTSTCIHPLRHYWLVKHTHQCMNGLSVTHKYLPCISHPYHKLGDSWGMSEVIGHNRFGTLPFESYNHEDLQYVLRVGKAKDYDIRQVNIMYFFIMNKHLFFEWYMLRCGSKNIHKKTHVFHIMGSIVNKISIPLWSYNGNRLFTCELRNLRGIYQHACVWNILHEFRVSCSTKDGWRASEPTLCNPLTLINLSLSLITKCHLRSQMVNLR